MLAPETAPLNLTTVLEAEDCIKLTWNAPIKPRAAITGFRVFMDRLGDDRYVDLDVPVTQTFYGIFTTFE